MCVYVHVYIHVHIHIYIYIYGTIINPRVSNAPPPVSGGLHEIRRPAAAASDEERQDGRPARQEVDQGIIIQMNELDSLLKGALQLLIKRYGYIRFAHVHGASFDLKFRRFEYRKLEVESLRRTGNLQLARQEVDQGASKWTN